MLQQHKFVQQGFVLIFVQQIPNPEQSTTEMKQNALSRVLFNRFLSSKTLNKVFCSEMNKYLFSKNGLSNSFLCFVQQLCYFVQQNMDSRFIQQFLVFCPTNICSPITFVQQNLVFVQVFVQQLCCFVQQTPVLSNSFQFLSNNCYFASLLNKIL